MRTLVRPLLGRVRRRAERSERGDTLIELLIAIVIIALTVTALLGALVTSLTSSATQKSLSTVDAVLNSFAQSAQYEAQQAFVNCTPTPYRLVSAPMPAAGPVGASVVVFVTGFAANTGLHVTLTPAGGGGSVPATITSGSTTDPTNGNATVTFTVPGSVTGAQNVSVSDGTSTTSPTPFVVGGTTKGTAPVGYSISVNPVQQWDAQGSSWVAAAVGSCPDSGAQQLTAFAQGPNGASGTLSFVVLHAATTTVLVASAPSPGDPASCSPTIVLGCSVTFTATVIPPNSTTPYPQGTIQWVIAGPNSPTCSNSALANIVGTNTSQATCKVTNAWAGPFKATATYLAGGNYGTGGGSGVANVAAASSSTTITTSSSPSPAQPGSTLSFTATIGATPANSNDPQPSENVTWTITAPSGTAPSCTGGDTQVMNNNGTGTNSTTCSFTLPTNAPLGTYSASANYGGDTNYTSSVSSAAMISVNKGTSTLKFTPPQSPQVGSPFTVTVTVQGNGSVTPQGTVTWTITPPSGSVPTCTPSTLSPSGQATCQVTPTVAGSYTVAAAYGGNTAYNSASGQISVAVTLAPAGFNIQTTGNPADNKPDGVAGGGDTIVYTYNQVMAPSSIMNGLNLNQPVNVTAVFSRQTGATSLTIQCTGFRCQNPNLGTVSLGDTAGSHYVGLFGMVSLNATMVLTTNSSGQSVITITLTQSNGGLSAVSGNTTLTWSPSSSATNAASPPVACATTPVTEVGAPKANF